jgi:hypothetical protein
VQLTTVTVLAPPAVPGHDVDDDVIVSVIVVECEIEPLVPVTFRLYVPALAVDDAVILSVDVVVPPDGGVGDALLKLVLTPAIEGDVESVTGDENPLTDVMVRVDDTDEPVLRLKEFGDALILKSLDVE